MTSVWQPPAPVGTPRKRITRGRIAIGVVGVLFVLALIGSLLPHDNPTTAAPSAAGTTSSQPAAKAASPDGEGDTALAWVRQNYSGTPWLASITGAHEQSDVLWVDTRISPANPDRAAIAQPICSAFSAWQITESGHGFTGVRVAAADGQRIVLRRSISESC